MVDVKVFSLIEFVSNLLCFVDVMLMLEMILSWMCIVMFDVCCNNFFFEINDVGCGFVIVDVFNGLIVGYLIVLGVEVFDGMGGYSFYM